MVDLIISLKKARYRAKVSIPTPITFRSVSLFAAEMTVKDPLPEGTDSPFLIAFYYTTNKGICQGLRAFYRAFSVFVPMLFIVM